MTTLELAKTVPELLEQIRQVTEGGNYIFRGENKINDKICSNLYRYFNTIAGRAALQQRNIKFDFNPIKKELESQLSKDAQHIDFDVLSASLKENILNQLAQKDNHSPKVEKIQKDFILQDVQEYVDFENEDDTLTELQHYGGLTNLIDFSRDIAISLFFACDGEPDMDGRLIVLRADLDLEHLKIISPKKSQNNRTVFQKSIFVRCDLGYIIEQCIEKQIIVSKNLKSSLLTYLQNYFNIRTTTVYGDLMGYVQNQEMHREAYEQLFVGLILSHDGKHDESVKCYDKALKIKPNFPEAYRMRGYVHYCIGRDIQAKAGKNEAIAEYEKCVLDQSKAIKLKPNYALAYFNRGVANVKLSNYKEGEKDFKTTLQLAEEQGLKDIASRTKIIIEKELPSIQDNNSPPTVP